MIITFFSSHNAMKAERILKKMGKDVDLIPVPREISSECGFCVLVENESYYEKIEQTDIESIWSVTVKDKGKEYVRIK